MKVTITKWLGKVREVDDFGEPFLGELFDAKTKMGPWATMSRKSWEHYRFFKDLGTGKGQRYIWVENGYYKVEG